MYINAVKLMILFIHMLPKGKIAIYKTIYLKLNLMTYNVNANTFNGPLSFYIQYSKSNSKQLSARA